MLFRAPNFVEMCFCRNVLFPNRSLLYHRFLTVTIRTVAKDAFISTPITQSGKRLSQNIRFVIFDFNLLYALWVMVRACTCKISRKWRAFARSRKKKSYIFAWTEGINRYVFIQMWLSKISGFEFFPRFFVCVNAA